MSWKAHAKHQFIDLLIKIAALLSICGGPLVVMDTLRPLIGRAAALIVVCAPSALIYLGAISLRDPDTNRWRNTFVWIGVVGVSILSLMNAYAVWYLVAGRFHPNRGLVIFGIVVGIVTAAVFAYFANRVLRRRSDRRLDAATLQGFGGPIE
jgi:hypothetical protein